MSEARESLWESRSERPRFNALHQDITVDVVVIGAGITGLLTADALVREGKSVAVLDRSRVGCGCTGHSTAQLTALLDAGYVAIEKKFGRDAAKIVARGMSRAVDDLEALTLELGAGRFERVPAYYYPHEESAVNDVRDEHDAAVRAGLAAEYLDAIPFPLARYGGLALQGQGQLDPIELVAALALRVQRSGGEIYEVTPVLAIEDGEPCRVRTPNATVIAADVVMATHTPLGISLLQTEVAPYRSYVSAVRLSKPMPEGLFFDSADPYRYTRIVSAAEPNVVLVGGADHKTGNGSASNAYKELDTWTRASLDVDAVLGTWSSQYYDPADGLPYIGRTHGHTYVATGYSGDGFPFGCIAARLLSQSILGVTNDETQLYSPTRVKPIASAKNFVKENIAVARHFVADRLSSEEVRSLDEVGRGEGRLVQLGLHKVAAYREHTGELRVLRPVCTHMKCIVQWNAAETSWDCPCHGGRFDVRGKPIEGPPVTALEPFDLPQRIKPDDERVVVSATTLQPTS